LSAATPAAGPGSLGEQTPGRDIGDLHIPEYEGMPEEFQPTFDMDMMDLQRPAEPVEEGVVVPVPAIKEKQKEKRPKKKTKLVVDTAEKLSSE
jgi:saccharopine dehydrogenase-like NADP-dependent oxidoreductase